MGSLKKVAFFQIFDTDDIRADGIYIGNVEQIHDGDQFEQRIIGFLPALMLEPL